MVQLRQGPDLAVFLGDVRLGTLAAARLASRLASGHGDGDVGVGMWEEVIAVDV